MIEKDIKEGTIFYKVRRGKYYGYYKCIVQNIIRINPSGEVMEFIYTINGKLDSNNEPKIFYQRGRIKILPFRTNFFDDKIEMFLYFYKQRSKGLSKTIYPMFQEEWDSFLDKPEYLL